MTFDVNGITFKIGGAELLDAVEPLWLQLIAHHSNLSPFFADEIASRNFLDRRTELAAKAAAGKLRVELVFDSDSAVIGYLICSIDGSGEGEIDSIFLRDPARSRGIGSTLMNRAMMWLDAEGAKKKFLVVATGNERVYAFYARYGFFPIANILRHKSSE